MAPRGALRNLGLILVLLLAAASPTLAWRRRPHRDCGRGEDAAAVPPHPPSLSPPSSRGELGLFPAFVSAPPRDHPEPAPEPTFRSPPLGGGASGDCYRCAPGYALHLLRVPAPALLPMPPPLLSHPQEFAPRGPDGPALFSHETKALIHSVVERPGCCPAPQEAAPQGAEQPAPLRAHRSSSRGDCYRCAPGSAVCLLRVPAPAPRGRGGTPSTAVCPTLFGLKPSVAHPTSTSFDWLLPSWLVLPPLLRACAGRRGLATVLGPG